jgi:hypothetical protein
MNLRPIQEAFKDGRLQENRLLETPRGKASLVL